VNRSPTVKFRFHAGVRLDRPFAGDPGEARQTRRSWRGGGGVASGQTPAAHPKACTTACAVPDFMGSVGGERLHAFGVTQTPEHVRTEATAKRARQREASGSLDNKLDS